MPLVVPILAPAPVRHVPARSRHARLSYAPVVEEAPLRELSLGDAPEGPRLPVNGGKTVATRILDGRLWRGIGADDPFAGPDVPDNRRITREEFVGWLRGRDDTRWMDEGDFGRCLEGTPLLARVPGQRAPRRQSPSWDTAKQGRLILDARDAVPGRVSRFVSESIALVDGTPFMRMEGPFAYLTAGMHLKDDGPATMRLLRHPGGWTTNPAVNFANLYRHDRLFDPYRAQLVSPSRIEPQWNPDELLGYGAATDDDLMLNLREAARSIAASAPSAGYPFPPEALSAMEDIVALGSVGAIEDDDLPAAWSVVADFCRRIEMNPVGWITREAKRIRSYAFGVVEPRLRARATAAPADAVADLDALSGLAPG